MWRWDQAEPFGDSPADENPNGAGTFDLPLRLPGQYYDAESGLHQNNFRDYDPSLGIYKQSDPIGLDGGINPYVYVGNAPTRYTDPTGLCIEDLCIGEAAAAVAWCATNPACAAGVVAIVGGAIYSQSNSEKPPRVTDPEAYREWQDYKNKYDERPPPNLDECEMLRWQLKREQALLAARQAWDAKWGPHHASAIAQSQKAIRNLKRKLKMAGCPCP